MSNPSSKRRCWSEELIVSELKEIINSLDFMPTSTYLREIGRNDLMCAISKSGGWKYYSQKLGVEMTPSDTLTGWKAEDWAEQKLKMLGYTLEKQKTRDHFDFLINNSIRIDIKGASFAQYGASSGWFYRMGKVITADIVMCVRMDKEDFYLFPWFRVPSTNLTITPTGKAHSFYYNNLDILNKMVECKKQEFELFPECIR